MPERVVKAYDVNPQYINGKLIEIEYTINNNKITFINRSFPKIIDTLTKRYIINYK